MRIARVRHAGGVSTAFVDGGLVRLAAWDLFANKLEETGTALPLDEVALLVPCTPTKIVGVARNYRAHAAELGNEAPEEEPLFFLKAPSALVPDRGAITIPDGCGRVDYEGELALVIGRRARNVSPQDYASVVAGYTIVNDVTARALQKRLGHFSRAKNLDTFCPVGPWIETELDPADLSVVTRLNGETVQDGRTSQMIHPVGRLISFLSSVFTLEPGDLVATGTPAGVGPLAPGDTVAVTVEGIGTLTNTVQAETSQ